MKLYIGCGLTQAPAHFKIDQPHYQFVRYTSAEEIPDIIETFLQSLSR